MLFALATMSGAHVFIDRSAFPDAVRRDLLESLRSRAINHRFHYESYKQAAKWLALHEAYSPARKDASCVDMYAEAFRHVTAQLGDSVHLVGLGCGGGQKEAQFLSLLNHRSKVRYSACDVSLPLVLTARLNALEARPSIECHGVVCDLANAPDLKNYLSEADAQSPRVLTLFGIIPNFEPAPLLSRVAALLSPGESLLLSANLAPGDDYGRAVERILPQYNNPLTCDWLFTLMSDLGFESSDGTWSWSIEKDARGLRRITANYLLLRARTVSVSGETFAFAAGEKIRLFYSYRHTPETIRALVAEQGLALEGSWLNNSGEEGVFLCRRHS